MRTSTKPSPTPLIFLLIGIGVLLFGALFGQPPAPCPIRVVAPTEQSVIREMKFEQLQKQYQRATATARQVYRKNHCRGDFADITGRAAVDFGISPRVLAALVFVESTCRPNAISGRKSVGLTQVNPLVWKYTRAELRDPKRNLEIGASILASYVHRFGLVEGLHHYNGLGNPTNEYAEKVLTAAGISI